MEVSLHNTLIFMRKNIFITFSLVVMASLAACQPQKKERDRSSAHEMFEHISSLTKSYIRQIEAAEDSATWARVCLEYEDSLDKVNFTYPPDTDLLLSEGQNDTLVNLSRAYVHARDSRIHEILHPVNHVDTVDTLDSRPIVAPLLQ